MSSEDVTHLPGQGPGAASASSIEYTLDGAEQQLGQYLAGGKHVDRRGAIDDGQGNAQALTDVLAATSGEGHDDE